MATVIQCMNEFKLTSTKMKNMSECDSFAAHIYAIAWTACAVANDATANDLMLFWGMKEHAEINKVVSQMGLKKLHNLFLFNCTSARYLTMRRSRLWTHDSQWR